MSFRIDFNNGKLGYEPHNPTAQRASELVETLGAEALDDVWRMYSNNQGAGYQAGSHVVTVRSDGKDARDNTAESDLISEDNQ